MSSDVILPISDDEIYQKCVYISANFKISQSNLIHRYGWQKTDSRIVILTKGIRILNALTMGIDHLITDLKNPEWWQKRFPTQPVTPLNQNLLCIEFETLLRVALIQNIYGAVESTIRVLANAYNPELFKESAVEFSKLYPNFLEKLNLSKYESLIRIYGYLRNALVHNDGLFIPKDKKNKNIPYNGKDYPFKVGEYVNSSWFNILDLTFDIGAMTYEVVTHNNISSIENIEEPASKYWNKNN